MTSGFGRSHARQGVGGVDLHGLATVATTEVILERTLSLGIKRTYKHARTVRESCDVML